MARRGDRRLYDVAVETAASELLHAVSNTNERSAGLAEPLSSLFALNFNFKPDSTHDCRRGALFQPGPGRSDTSEWQMELEATDAHAESSTSAINSATKKPAHVFTGPQTTAKAYDLVLIWDDDKQTYRLDRVAASFALKYERSRTTLSDQAQTAWTSDFKTPRKRERDNEIIKAGDQDRSPKKPSLPLKPAEGMRASKSAHQREAARPSTVVAPLRRSSRRSVAVEMEEFEDSPPPPKFEADADEIHFRVAPRAKFETEAGTVLIKTGHEETNPSTAAGELRRSRRRSSQQWQQTTISSKWPDEKAEGAAHPGKAQPTQTLEEDEEDLALELERELEREFDVEILSEDEPPPSPPAKPVPVSSEPRSARKLSPVSRLQQSERERKVSTPKAHTPDIEDVPVISAPSSKKSKRALSPMSSADRSTPGAEASRPASQAVASIGLGLQQTGVGITPTASPHLDVASPAADSRPRASPDEDIDSGKEAFDALAPASPEREEDDDDDLQDFAAELDMSLAEGPDASPVIPSQAVEKRRSSRVSSASQTASDARSSAIDRFSGHTRKAYGLGGPRQEEEDLEDSD